MEQRLGTITVDGDVQLLLYEGQTPMYAHVRCYKEFKCNRGRPGAPAPRFNPRNLHVAKRNAF